MKSNNKSITVLGIVSTALFVMISAVLVALFVPGTLKPLSVQTGSMEPGLSPGDLVLVKKGSAQDYQIGDVITFVNPTNAQQTITHRIIDRSGSGDNGVFMTQGDANSSPDQPINEMLVVGEVVGSVPYAGKVVDFARSWAGLVTLIYIPALIIVISETKRLNQYYKSLQPYTIYGNESSNNPVPGAAVVVAMVSLGSIFVTAIPASAIAKTSATLESNSLSMLVVPAPSEPEVPVVPDPEPAPVPELAPTPPNPEKPVPSSKPNRQDWQNRNYESDKERRLRRH